MNHPLPNLKLQCALNPAAMPGAPYGARQQAVLGGEAFVRAAAQIRRWPGYAPTPLVALDGLAQAAGVAQILYKDEGDRFGLGSFKALGGAYAVSCLLVREIGSRLGVGDVSVDDLLSGRYADVVRDITVTCATDGNHGRSVAWGAQRFGCQCVIYIHATVSEGRKAAIEQYGAQVVRTAGNYDDSVRQAAEDAARLGRFVVSDTSYEGYMEVPKDVMQGYAVMADEALHQLPDDQLPTHVFLQGGVGGLAAAVCAHFWEALGDKRPRFIVVEPDKAACLYESARAGKPVAVHGDLDTVMAGLACGEVSLLAWEVLHPGAHAFLSIDDASALESVRLLADSRYGDAPIVAGESAVAGLAGCLGAMADPATRKQLGLSAASRVLVFGSEGATDVALYQRIVGRLPEDVRKAA
ncbi:diaminopropionate ammonia-lyase [Cupriavidus consociatus]|uniref:diaminopropionate ammonia-lyase n=1 Tax=Cupriavidus consociatus TaxID=2821357 RepID=UPI001AE93A69|nr:MULTISPECIES: diaminopropionate ammonia-lyase [unclassified Cupriavidus]MBP0624124.1 diaminopropionate ammonia-lyase [Cupriavidus sp. LEh25]MDK2660837.1 diaminopropionate ammonia-lyase [Cupriavidus sp. LEh21]